MVAGRAIDEEDIVSILTKNRDVLDFEYIEQWLSEFGSLSEHEGILERFNALLNQ